MADTRGRMTLWGIEVFVAVVKSGAISAAARQLDTSASTVSQQITNLETAIGAHLIDRAARPVEMTPAGALFHRRALSILSEADRARSELSIYDLSKLMRFRLGIIEDFDSDVTPRLLSDMAEELKSCHFVLETGASYHLAGMLEDRALDVIVAVDLDIAAEWMEIYPLLADPFMIVAPKNLVDPNAGIMDQLNDIPFIRYSSRQMMGRQIEAHLSGLGLKLPHRFELDSYHAIMSMVAAGAGWTITTPLGYSHAKRFMNDVSAMALPFAPMARNISLFARKDALDSLPQDIAARLRPLLQTMIVDPCVAEMPWLKPLLLVRNS